MGKPTITLVNRCADVWQDKNENAQIIVVNERVGRPLSE